MPVAKDLTELIAIDPQRVDRVKTPASGFPVLIMKSALKDVNTQGGIDEKPDVDHAEQVLQLLAILIGAESREMAVGQWDEICDIELLCEAAHLIGCFRRNEMYGDEDDGDSIMKSADFPARDELESVATYVLKRKISTAERKRLASEGKALPDGSYPIENAEDLHNAAVLARSGHGDVAAAKRLIAKRAKELGVPNPLAASASKDAPVTDIPTPDVKPDETPAPVEKSTADLVAEAVSKAVSPFQETIKGLESELAALKAMPNTAGAPVITAAKSTAFIGKSNDAEAARYERLAKSVSDRELARYYAERAKEAREASK